MIMSVKEHFGDHDPSEEEVRQFLRDRLGVVHAYVYTGARLC